MSIFDQDLGRLREQIRGKNTEKIELLLAVQAKMEEIAKLEKQIKNGMELSDENYLLTVLEIPEEYHENIIAMLDYMSKMVPGTNKLGDIYNSVLPSQQIKIEAQIAAREEVRKVTKGEAQESIKRELDVAIQKGYSAQSEKWKEVFGANRFVRNGEFLQGIFGYLNRYREETNIQRTKDDGWEPGD